MFVFLESLAVFSENLKNRLSWLAPTGAGFLAKIINNDSIF